MELKYLVTRNLEFKRANFVNFYTYKLSLKFLKLVYLVIAFFFSFGSKNIQYLYAISLAQIIKKKNPFEESTI